MHIGLQKKVQLLHHLDSITHTISVPCGFVCALASFEPGLGALQGASDVLQTRFPSLFVRRAPFTAALLTLW
eukprot:6039780-Amphidinium_carterae.1